VEPTDTAEGLVGPYASPKELASSTPKHVYVVAARAASGLRSRDQIDEAGLLLKEPIDTAGVGRPTCHPRRARVVNTEPSMLARSREQPLVCVCATNSTRQICSRRACDTNAESYAVEVSLGCLWADALRSPLTRRGQLLSTSLETGLFQARRAWAGGSARPISRSLPVGGAFLYCPPFAADSAGWCQ